jgi:peptide/nickel transport system permease protein
MFYYIVRRLLLAIPTLLGITLVTFIVIHAAPGDPVQLKLYSDEGRGSETLTRVAYEQLRTHYGLDKPFLVQYLIWLRNTVLLDFGSSYQDGRPVTGRILSRLPATLELNGLSLLLMVFISVPVGILSAARRNSVYDKLSGFVFYVLYALPYFWIALVLIMVFGVRLRWLPFLGNFSTDTAGFTPFGLVVDHLKHLVLPVLCMTYGGLAYLSRFTRAVMLETIGQDYIRTAKAKGLREKTVILRHAFRNSLISLVTHLGLLLPVLVSGSVILEYIFTWPGIGRLFFEAVLTRDYPTIMGLSFISAVLVLAGTLLADILYAVADPRVQYG